MLGKPVACLLILASAAAQAEDAEDAKLDRAWQSWVKFVDRGRLPPATRNWQVRGAILPVSMRLVPESRQLQYTRMNEAEDLITLLILRGSYADGQHIVHLLTLRQPKRPEARRWFPKLRMHVIEELERGDLHVGLQAALLDKLEEGAVRIKGKGQARSHSDPALASILLPLLGGFHGNRFRPVLEQYLESGDGSLILAATEGLSRMSSGASIGKVLEAMPHVVAVAERRKLGPGFHVEWWRLIREQRWVGFNWPKDCGGGGGTIMEQFVLKQEMLAARGTP